MITEIQKKRLWLENQKGSNKKKLKKKKKPKECQMLYWSQMSAE